VHYNVVTVTLQSITMLKAGDADYREMAGDSRQQRTDLVAETNEGSNCSSSTTFTSHSHVWLSAHWHWHDM